MKHSLKHRRHKSWKVLGVAASMTVLFVLVVYAAATVNWPFTTPANYTVYEGDGSVDADNSDIIVDGIIVKLVNDGSEFKDDTLAEYKIGTYSGTAGGPDATVVLTMTAGVYDASGTFTSRTLDGGSGNTWNKVKVDFALPGYCFTR